jgi:prevent-host-death family protein
LGVKSIQATALRRKLYETLKKVAYERSPVSITRRGKEIARIVPVSTQGKPEISPAALAEFCRRHSVKELYLFGSILNDDFGDDSDVDVMIEMNDADAPQSFEESFAMTDELEEIFGREVDLLTKKAVTSSQNRHRKKSILESARLVYPPPQ